MIFGDGHTYSAQQEVTLSFLFIRSFSHGQIGAYHTLDLELNQVFSIEKDVWDTIHLERIETSSDAAKKVVMLSFRKMAFCYVSTPIKDIEGTPF